MILVIFGSGVNCAVTLSSNPGSVLGPPKGVNSIIHAEHVHLLTPALGLAFGVIRLGSWYGLVSISATVPCPNPIPQVSLSELGFQAVSRGDTLTQP